jgi:hypothetical protein
VEEQVAERAWGGGLETFIVWTKASWNLWRPVHRRENKRLKDAGYNFQQTWRNPM